MTRAIDAISEPIISVHRDRLSDGSYVFNVRLGEIQLLHATTEDDAYKLATKINDAIWQHALERSRIVSYALKDQS